MGNPAAVFDEVRQQLAGLIPHCESSYLKRPRYAEDGKSGDDARLAMVREALKSRKFEIGDFEFKATVRSEAANSILCERCTSGAKARQILCAASAAKRISMYVL